MSELITRKCAARHAALIKIVSQTLARSPRYSKNSYFEEHPWIGACG